MPPAPEASTSTPIVPPPAPVPAPATVATVPAPSTPETSSTPSTAPEPAPAAAQPAFGDTSAFLSGTALQSTISNMVEMGFEREQVMKALRASYNNPDRAVEYLMTVSASHLHRQIIQT
jgi:UV excision repair protein RAD23